MYFAHTVFGNTFYKYKFYFWLIAECRLGKNLGRKADFLYYEALIEFRKENYETAAELVEKININELMIKRQPYAIKLKGDIYHHKKNDD